MRLLNVTRPVSFSSDKWQSFLGVWIILRVLTFEDMEGDWSVFSETSTDYNGNRSNAANSYNALYEQFMTYYHYRTYLCAIVLGPLISLGLVGNVISFFTLAKLTHQNAVTFLLRVLAIIDFCLLLCVTFVVFTYKIPSRYQFDGWLYTASSLLWAYRSAYGVPLANCFILVHCLTHVAIGMNRYIVMCRSFQVDRLCTVSHAKKQMLCIILVAILFHLPNFVDCEVKKTTDGTPYIVNTLRNNKWYIYLYHIGCNYVFCFFIPFGVLTFFYLRIVTSLRAAKRRLLLTRHGDLLRDIKVTSMVLVLLQVFLVCNGLVWINYPFFVDSDHIFHWRMIGYYARSCSEMLIIVNSSVNVVIYHVHIEAFRIMLCKGRRHRSEINQANEMV